MSAPVPVPKWSVENVVAFLGSIGLPQLGDAFKANAVNGSDLLFLTDEDFKESLGCTPLQVKKIRKELEAWGVHGPGAAAPAPAPAPLAETTPVAAPAAAAPASGDGRSASNQGEITQLQARLAEVQGGAQRYAQGQQQLRRAEELLKSAKGSLTITQVSGGTEMIQDMRIGMRGGGMFGPRRGVGRAMDRRNDLGHNVVEMATIQKASKAVKEAGVAMQAARQVLPNLPYIQPANVQAAMGGVMFNALLAPGLIGDMMQNAKVRKAKDEVNEMHVQVVQALDWCTNNMQAAQSEAAQINASLQAKMAAAH